MAKPHTMVKTSWHGNILNTAELIAALTLKLTPREKVEPYVSIFQLKQTLRISLKHNNTRFLKAFLRG